MIRFSNTRVKSRNAKQGIRSNPLVIKKIDAVSRGIPRGGGVRIRIWGCHKNIFQLLTRRFSWLID